jgi:VWFA-related protein
MKAFWLPSTILIAQLATSSLAQQPAPSPSPTPPAQTSPAQKPEDVDVVRITTNLVQVDAVVTDKNGKVVTDLKPEEVQIFEDGRQQKVTHFSYYVAESASAEKPTKPVTVDKNAPPVPPNRLRPEDIRRTIALVVDDLGLSFESTYYVRRALKKFVDEQMQPGDLVAIIRTSGGMGALQQFTSDKRQLYAAIERVKWNSIGRSGVSAFAPIEQPTSGPGGADIDAFNEEANQTRQDMFAVGTLGAISYVVKGLKTLPGRKSILLISDGFRIYSPDDPTRNFQARDRLRRLIDEAGRASVVIYTMNATGLQTLGFTAADDLSGRDTQQLQDAMTSRRNEAFETQAGLDFLARETGGIPIRNTNDLSGGIKRVMEDQKGYYLIGYRPDNATFDARTGRRTFHRLTLKVTRPGKFNVRMRNGFFGVSDEDKPAPRTLAQQMFDALAAPFAANGVRLQLTSLFGNDAKAGSFMRSVLHIDGHDLTFTDEPDHLHKCVFDVLAMTFGDNGVPVDQNGKTYTLKLADEWYKRTLRDGLVYYVTVPVKKPGAYQLRMSLRDTNTERIGSASQFVEVPDLKKNRLALSGLALSGEMPTSKTTQSNQSPGNPAGANQPANDSNSAASVDHEGVERGNAEASPAVRHFRSGMLMNYAFFIYNAHLDKATNNPKLTTQVRLFRDGKPVFTGNENVFKVLAQADLKRLLAGGSIQLGTDLPAGEYVFQIIVNDAIADEKHRTVSQWMDFEIVK